MSKIIRTGLDGAVATITIDHGAKGNLLTLDLLGELSMAFRAVAASDAKVIALRTTGIDFCRGRDPKGGPASQTAMAVRANITHPILDVYDAIANTPQPIVCSVQGAALGFGCALATACDVTLAAEDASFRLPEMEKNLPPTLAISAMMNKVPRKALIWMVYSMANIDAESAMRLGIVSSVVPTARLETAISSLLAQLSTRSREALVAVKDYMRTAPAMEPRGATDYAGNLLATVLSSAER